VIGFQRISSSDLQLLSPLAAAQAKFCRFLVSRWMEGWKDGRKDVESGRRDLCIYLSIHLGKNTREESIQREVRVHP